jgi:hypothetical protein
LIAISVFTLIPGLIIKAQYVAISPDTSSGKLRNFAHFVKGIGVEPFKGLISWDVQPASGECFAKGSWEGEFNGQIPRKGVKDFFMETSDRPYAKTFSIECLDDEGTSFEEAARAGYYIPEIRSDNTEWLFGRASSLADFNLSQVETISTNPYVFRIHLSPIEAVLFCGNVTQYVGFEIYLDNSRISFKEDGSSSPFADRLIYSQSGSFSKIFITDQLNLSPGKHILSVRLSYADSYHRYFQILTGRFRNSWNNLIGGDNQVNSLTLAMDASDKLERMTEITVSPEILLPVKILNFTASPPTIFPGQTSQLSWATMNADFCTINDDKPDYPDIGPVPQNCNPPECNDKQDVVNPLQTTTFTLTCVGGSQTARAQTTVTVQETNSRRREILPR